MIGTTYQLEERELQVMVDGQVKGTIIVQLPTYCTKYHVDVSAHDWEMMNSGQDVQTSIGFSRDQVHMWVVDFAPKQSSNWQRLWLPLLRFCAIAGSMIAFAWFMNWAFG
jgi:hypothetical protein